MFETLSQLLLVWDLKQVMNLSGLQFLIFKMEESD